MQVYNDEYLCHYGKLGMHWGHRKGPSTKEMRNERDKIHKQEFKKAYVKNKVQEKINESYDFANKHGLDGDDGGGGSRRAGAKYQTMMEEIDRLEMKSHHEAGLKTSERMLKKYGQEGINALEKSDKRRFALGAAAMMAIPATVLAATVYSDLH